MGHDEMGDIMGARLFMEAVLGFIYPRSLYCVLCGNTLMPGARMGVCDACCSSLPFIHPPTCRTCGKPVEQADFLVGDETVEGICPDCLHVSHDFLQATSVFEYTSSIQKLIYRYKYDGEYSLGATFSVFMAEALTGHFGWKVDLVLPVPLHPNRLKRRGFNQSAVLSTHIAEICGIDHSEDILCRCIDTPTQTRLGRHGRAENLKNAFCVRDKSKIDGKTLLLIDDVYTTGATADSCTIALKKAGAAGVFVLTLATGRNI